MKPASYNISPNASYKENKIILNYSSERHRNFKCQSNFLFFSLERYCWVRYCLLFIYNHLNFKSFLITSKIIASHFFPYWKVEWAPWRNQFFEKVWLTFCKTYSTVYTFLMFSEREKNKIILDDHKTFVKPSFYFLSEQFWKTKVFMKNLIFLRQKVNRKVENQIFLG